MKQRGRKSAVSLAVTPMRQRMLEPPADLAPAEVEVWCRVVATKPTAWWDAGSVPLLAQYARAAVQADLVSGLVSKVGENLKTDPDELVRYRELRKIQAGLSSELNVLARGMRLTQQARYRADAAAVAAKKGETSQPWQAHNVIEG